MAVVTLLQIRCPVVMLLFDIDGFLYILHREVSMEIKRLDLQDSIGIAGAAALLVESFPHAWPSFAEAAAEVAICLDPGKIALVAVEADQVVAFAGAMPKYDLTAWELHPLVVAKARQNQGIGRRLLEGLEHAVAFRGCLTLYAGSDDEFGQTSLSGCDLYDRLWERIRDVRNLRGHPYAFYLKQGYQIVGVIPDANGWGKPDIWLAKRVGTKV